MMKFWSIGFLVLLLAGCTSKPPQETVPPATPSPSAITVTASTAPPSATVEATVRPVMIEGKEYTERQLTGSGLIYYVRKELPDSLSIAVEESKSGAVIRVVKEEQTVLAEFQVTADPSSSQMEVICVQNGYTVLRRPVSVDGENAELARQVADLVIFPEGGK